MMVLCMASVGCFLIALGAIWLGNSAYLIGASPPKSTDFEALPISCTVGSIEHCWSQTINADTRTDICTDRYRVRFTLGGSAELVDAAAVVVFRTANAACKVSGCANSTESSTHGGGDASPTVSGTTYAAGVPSTCWQSTVPFAALHAVYQCGNPGCIKLYDPRPEAEAFTTTQRAGIIVGSLILSVGACCFGIGGMGLVRLTKRRPRRGATSPYHPEQQVPIATGRAVTIPLAVAVAHGQPVAAQSM